MEEKNFNQVYDEKKSPQPNFGQVYDEKKPRVGAFGQQLYDEEVFFFGVRLMKI
jgi:hypothetical protein